MSTNPRSSKSPRPFTASGISIIPLAAEFHRPGLAATMSERLTMTRK
jgi:hypothetical protein